MRIELRLPGQEHFEYRPGQYLDILLKNGERRPFPWPRGRSPANCWSCTFGMCRAGCSPITCSAPCGRAKSCACAVPTAVSGCPKARGARRCWSPGTGFAPPGHHRAGNRERSAASAVPLLGGRRAADLYLAELAAGWVAAHPQIRFVPVLADPDEASDGSGAVDAASSMPR